MIAAGEKTAARLLDLKQCEFRELVSRGALPGPVVLGGKFERWMVEDLIAILHGRGAVPDGEIE